MKTINDGGPAFPCIEMTVTGIDSSGVERMENEAHGGMTMRDKFADSAMQGLLAAGRDAQYGADSMDQLGRDAYKIADAMLTARSQA